VVSRMSKSELLRYVDYLEEVQEKILPMPADVGC